MRKFTAITVLEATEIWTNPFGELEGSSDSGPAVCEGLERKFGPYCVVSTFIALHEIFLQDTMFTLALDLLDPSKPHYKTMMAIVLHAEKNTQYFILKCKITHGQHLVGHLASRLQQHIFGSILQSQQLGGRVSQVSFACAEISAEQFHQVFPSKPTETYNLGKSNRLGIHKKILPIFFYDGTIIEIIAQKPRENKIALKPLLEYGVGLYDPSRVLLFLIGNHNHVDYCRINDYCPVERLLELGADPNMTGYQITPLQIAVAILHLDGVSKLLNAGADPNSISDMGGIRFEEGTVMARFNCLYRVSPFEITFKFQHLLS